MLTIPFVDLRAQYGVLREDLREAIDGVLAAGTYILGPNVSAFEHEFADFVGAPHAIGCGNGGDALEMVMRLWGARAGDEIIVPANSWIATASAATMYGAKPVFADTDARTFTIDPADVERKITFRTKAIVVSHLYGMPADMDALLRVARPRGIRVLEDCTQAHGARVDGHRVGTFGTAATFSFHPEQNLGAYGDAGAIVVNRDDDAETLRRIGNGGRLAEDDFRIEGRNSRLDELQAAILRVKLRRLDDWVEARQRHAARYLAQLADLSLTLPFVPGYAEPVWHSFVVLIGNRDGARHALAGEQIETRVPYPVALPFLPPFAHMRHTQDQFPVAHAHANAALSLPMYAELTDAQVDRVCDALRRFLTA